MKSISFVNHTPDAVSSIEYTVTIDPVPQVNFPGAAIRGTAEFPGFDFESGKINVLQGNPDSIEIYLTIEGVEKRYGLEVDDGMIVWKEIV